MGTIQPRARGGASLSEMLKARRLREEQLGRQRVDLPKMLPASAAGSAQQGFTRAKPGSVIQQAGSYVFTGWTFDQTWSNFGRAAPITSPVLTSPAGQNVTFDGEGFNVTADGWYWERVRVVTDSSASILALDLNNGANGRGVDMDSYYTRRTIVPTVGGGFDETVWCGPFWLGAQDGYAPLRFSALFPSGESPSHGYFQFVVDVIAGAR